MTESPLARYRYAIPEECVAKTPASPRDSARLMVAHTKTGMVSFDVFRNVDRYLPRRSLLVLNDTKVLPARITLHKRTGGKVVVLFLFNEWKKGEKVIRGMVDRMVVLHEPLFLTKRKWFTPVLQDANIFTFNANFPLETFSAEAKNHGATPIPPYLKATTLSERELRTRYQTIFAKDSGSVAAPTASLHFTKRVFEKLRNKDIKKAFVTLHVGLGTFAPIGAQNFATGKLHEEWFEVPATSTKTILKAKQAGRPIVAVGTTALRTLESVAPTFVSYSYDRTYMARNVREGISGTTNLFIYPPYEFKLVDALITNFHVPESSLMCLVDAFLRYKKSPKDIMELYALAKKEHMRFFSFGDAMLIL